MLKASVALAMVDIPVPPDKSTVSKLLIVCALPLSPDKVQLGDIGTGTLKLFLLTAVMCPVALVSIVSTATKLYPGAEPTGDGSFLVVLSWSNVTSPEEFVAVK